MYRIKMATLLASLRRYGICAILLGIGLSGKLAADQQMVSGEIIAGSGGTDIMLVLSYQTRPENQQTTGLGVSVYFDSSQLEFISMSADSAVANSLIGITSQPGHIADDADDNDADGSTDKVATIAFTSFNGRFPPSTAWTGTTDGVVIATLLFNATANSSAGMTTINYHLNTASAYSGSAASTSIEL
ncbi:MAG: hypothetical protein HOL98_04840 [Gammaproteobacteria bacterium]|nr:hypothetical protein [Gammaproteobacteria bacterium]MBT6245536.1 hypothetical protein [Gammaproteobacteria bacterium]